MTTEEIEKAAEEYAIKLDVSTFDCKAARKDFREGAKFANKHWQEKIRWIPVADKLPEIRDDYQILIKEKDGKYQSFWVTCEADLRFLVRIATHWREFI